MIYSKLLWNHRKHTTSVNVLILFGKRLFDFIYNKTYLHDNIN